MYFSATARRRVEMFAAANDLLLVARASKASAPTTTSSSICFEVRLKRIQSEKYCPNAITIHGGANWDFSSRAESFDDLGRHRLPTPSHKSPRWEPNRQSPV